MWRLVLNRSRVYAGLRARWGSAEETTTANTVVLGLNRPPNAVAPERVMQDREFVANHIAAYLSNWRQLVDLAKAFDYVPFCVLQPTGGLEKEYSVPLTMRDFGLEEEMAVEWIDAFAVMYEEADRQIAALQQEDPDHEYLNLRAYLSPSAKHFWDLVHVYDETNRKLAERIYQDLQPAIEARLSTAPVR